MSKKKLQIIGYEKDFVDFEDDNAYRSFICYIENQFLKKKDAEWVRSVLSKDKTEEWTEMFSAYFAECGFPSFTTRAAATDFLLNCVIENMFNENEAAQRLTGCEYAKHIQPKKESTENSEDLAQLVTELCSLLKITPHPDPMVSLEAACMYINKFLNREFIREVIAEKKRGNVVKTFDIKSFPSGLPTFPDPVMNIAARCFRLLEIETLRGTQTAINETLAAIQNLTVNKSL